MIGRWLAVDPGEDVGWSLWNGTQSVAASTTKMWPFADGVWAELNGEESELSDASLVREGVDPELNSGPLELIVCEDFRIYPWAAKSLAWDQVRTARLIGALTFMSRVFELDFVLQGAKIKERAVAGGAEELFYHPLHENRHQNDSLLHGVFYAQTELRS